jgi:hypothetical protein
MTDATPHRREPGRLLLTIARHLFSDAVIASVVVPTVADLQKEVAAASTPAAQVVARWRGYSAFWTLVLVAPFAFWRWSALSAAPVTFPELASADATTPRPPEINLSAIRVGANAGGLIFAVGSIAILVLGLPEWRWFFLVAFLGGLLVARALFAWHSRHPSRRGPENFVSFH